MSLGETIIYYGLGELYLLGSSMCMTSLVAQTVKRLPTENFLNVLQVF